MVGRCWSELNEAKVCEAARARRHCGHVRGRRQLMDSQRAGSPSKVRLAGSEGCTTVMKAWAFRRDSAIGKSVWATGRGTAGRRAGFSGGELVRSRVPEGRGS